MNWFSTWERHNLLLWYNSTGKVYLSANISLWLLNFVINVTSVCRGNIFFYKFTRKCESDSDEKWRFYNGFNQVVTRNNKLGIKYFAEKYFRNRNIFRVWHTSDSSHQKQEDWSSGQICSALHHQVILCYTRDLWRPRTVLWLVTS